MSWDNPANADEMRPEYDFSAGVRGKHHEQFKAGVNVVFLDADIAKVFKDSESVNRAPVARRHQEPLATGSCSMIPAGKPGRRGA
jgi:hypothetical protein